jgi:hypothetical protein
MTGVKARDIGRRANARPWRLEGWRGAQWYRACLTVHVGSTPSMAIAGGGAAKLCKALKTEAWAFSQS